MAKRWCVHAVSSVPTLRSIWLLGGQDEDEDEEEEEEEEEEEDDEDEDEDEDEDDEVEGEEDESEDMLNRESRSIIYLSRDCTMIKIPLRINPGREISLLYLDSNFSHS